MLRSGSEALVPFNDLAALHRPLLGDFQRVWDRALQSSSFVGGELVDEFERDWATYCGAGNAVGVGNGTDALELILTALGVGPGDQVIVPGNTFIATVEAIVTAGAEPVMVDVDPATLLMDPAAVEAAINGSTAAVIAVHLYGQPCDMTALTAIAKRHGLALVEDAAQAHGASWRGRRTGSLATAAAFSFYPGKNLGALGDGGAVVTDDDALADRIRSIADHGRGPAPGDSGLLGRNSRLDAVHAGILTVKLQHLDRWNAARRLARERLVDRLSDAPVEFVDQHPDACSVHHLNIVQVDRRDEVIVELATAGVATGLHYAQPCHRHPAFRGHRSLPEVDSAAGRILSLPLFPTITDQQIDLVADALCSAFAARERR